MIFDWFVTDQVEWLGCRVDTVFSFFKYISQCTFIHFSQIEPYWLFGRLVHVYPVSCLPCIMSTLYHVYPVSCLPCIMSTLYHVNPVSCLPFIMSTLYQVNPVTCLPDPCSMLIYWLVVIYRNYSVFRCSFETGVKMVFLNSVIKVWLCLAFSVINLACLSACK